MSFHSKNVWFRHYFKLKLSLFKLFIEFFTLNVAIDYFIKRNQKFEKKIVNFNEKISQNQMPEIIQLTR
jgi:hypothetical protein